MSLAPFDRGRLDARWAELRRQLQDVHDGRVLRGDPDRAAAEQLIQREMAAVAAEQAMLTRERRRRSAR